MKNWSEMCFRYFYHVLYYVTARLRRFATVFVICFVRFFRLLPLRIIPASNPPPRTAPVIHNPWVPKVSGFEDASAMIHSSPYSSSVVASAEPPFPFPFRLTMLPVNAASAQLAYTHTDCMEGGSTPFTISKAPSTIQTNSIITEEASPIHVPFPNTVLRDIFTYPRFLFWNIFHHCGFYGCPLLCTGKKRPRPGKMPDRGLLHAFLGIIPRSLRA